MALPTDGNAALNNPSHFTEHQRVSDSLALLNSTAWIVLTYSGGWADYNPAAGFEKGSYRKVGDIVQLQGLANGPTGATTITTLPVGYRPKRQHLVNAAINGGSVRIDINIDG